MDDDDDDDDDYRKGGIEIEVFTDLSVVMVVGVLAIAASETIRIDGWNTRQAGGKKVNSCSDPTPFRSTPHTSRSPVIPKEAEFGERWIHIVAIG